MAIEDAKGILLVQNVSRDSCVSKSPHRSSVAIEVLKDLLSLHKPQVFSATIEDFKDHPWSSIDLRGFLEQISKF